MDRRELGGGAEMARQKPERKMRGPKPKRREVVEKPKPKPKDAPRRVCRDCRERGCELGNRLNVHAWCPLKKRYVARKLKACRRFEAKGGAR